MGDFSEYGKVELRDERLSNRLPRLLDQLAENPSASISAACGDPYQAKAAYRFISNDSVTTDAITEITRDVTMNNIFRAKPAVLLMPQDTTIFNFSNLKSTDGLGSIGARWTDAGIMAHSAIAMDDKGVIYGLLAQSIWVRPPEEKGKQKPRNRQAIEDKESYKWIETVEKIGSSFPDSTLVVHICDREGDIYELFCRAESEGVHYLCRRSHNRRVESESGDEVIDDFVEGLPVSDTITVQVPRDSHTGRVARDAVLEIKHGKCQIKKPSILPTHNHLPKSIEVYIISATEKDPPQGQEKIFWQLITNVSTENTEDAVTRMQWYMQRWKIETFHRTLKSGCKVEELQSESADKLMKLIAIYSIVALQIMELTYLGRAHPQETCEISFSDNEWKLLYRVSNKTKAVPDKPPTIYEAVVMIAKLGGFLGRKSDGFPGVTVIWRGLTKFYTILEASDFLV